MDFLELVTKRGSIRGYKSDPVEDEKLLAVLEATRMAPTAHNNQPFRLIVKHTKGQEENLSKIYGRPWFIQAPIVICIVGVPAEGWIRQDGKNYYEVDVAIAMDHLILAAHSLGLGTCWIGAFNPEAASEFLNLPDEVIPMAFTPLGYPNKEPRQKVRKPLNELVFYEQWDQ
ncbi:nitroreductase family protein [Chloroflexota bacterium]